MSFEKFKLTLAAKKSGTSIGYRDKSILLGSCFSENMGMKFQAHHLEVLENPHGILFNPISVVDALSDYMLGKVYTEEELFNHQDLWHSWAHHSRFSGISPEAALQKMNKAIQHANSYLKSANFLVITLGSAWLYHLEKGAPLYKDSFDRVVANNHKGPAVWFRKSLMEPAVLLHTLTTTIRALSIFNPTLKIIFTISPVRHLREGLIENNRSKAVLIQAVHQLVAQFEQVEYFPAYEYVIDDLRDYRFYAEDLVHPNYAATNYVWEKWVQTYMTSETQDLMKQVFELELAKQHKPFHVQSEVHQNFIISCIQKTERLATLYPYIDLSSNLSFFKAQKVVK